MGVGRLWRLWEGFLEGVERLPGGCEGCGDYVGAVWRVWKGSLDVLGSMSGGCEEAVWWISRGCLEVTERL